MTLQIPTVTIDDLRAFHAQHFPHAQTPHTFLHGANLESAYVDEYFEEDDALGYYPDGVKRTLTDEQIAMFRHSEIQTVIRKRRNKEQVDDLSDHHVILDVSTAAAAEANVSPRDVDESLSSVSTPTSEIRTANVAYIDKVPAEKVDARKVQQWATSSARTKARNKKHRDKYKRKKQEARRKREEGDADASDEWDAWHQAKGPDNQKDVRVELEY